MNNAQLLTLKAAILADSAIADLVAQGATGAIAEYLRTNSTFVVWRTATATQDIYDAINWANLTPADAPDSTQLWLNRAIACQGKQFNLQTLLQGRDHIRSSKANIRAGLQDALTAIPSGPGGANRNGGSAAVQTAMQRFATIGEKIFATGTGTAASPGNIVLEAVPTDYEVVQALTQV